MLVVLSLDSVSSELVDQLMSAGDLPNLARLTRGGQTVPLAEELPGAAYPTLYTGRRLADHGIYFPLQWSPSLQQTRPAEEQLTGELEQHSLFKRLANNGVRVLVLDPPECAPHTVEHSVLASGVSFRARVLLHEWARPESTGRELRAAYGRAPRADEVFGEPTLRYLLNVHRQLIQGPERLAQAAEHLVARSDFDLVWITFAAAHQAGHVLWSPTFLKGPVSPRDERTLEGAVSDVYRRIDEALGRILARLPAGADILILNSKGMGPNTSRTELLGGALDLVLNQGTAPGSVQNNLLWRLRACLPQSFRSAAAMALGDSLTHRLVGRADMAGRDWRRTRAFALPCEVHGFIRFNLKGREAQGVVRVEDAGALTDEITEGLLTFEDMGGEKDGGPSVKFVEPIAARVGRGDSVSLLPDLIVHWSEAPTARVRGLHSPRFGDVLRAGVGAGRAGNHCPGNWATVVPGKSRLVENLPANGRLEDVAATICAALGVAHPDLSGTARLAS